MIPDIETMIEDMTRWLPRPNTLEIWWDADSTQFNVGVMGEIFRNQSLKKCLGGAWAYCDRNRNKRSWSKEGER